MTENKPKKHHYVPQTYLKHFCCDIKNKLHVFDVRQNKILPPRKLEAIAYQKHFHRMPEPVGTSLESGFFCSIEKKYNALVEKISKGQPLSITDKSIIDEEELTEMLSSGTPEEQQQTASDIFHRLSDNTSDRMQLAMFVSAQWLRVPAQKERIHSFAEQVLQGAVNIHLHHEGHSNLKDQIKPQVEDWFWLRETPNSIATMAAYVFRGRYLILTAPERTGFVVGDNPVFLNHPQLSKRNIPFGIGILGAQMVVPLTRRHALIVVTTHEPHNIRAPLAYQEISAENVRELNQQQIRNTTRMVYGGNEKQLRDLQKRFQL